MARPPFIPTGEQRRTLAALERIARKRAKLDTEADELIAQAEAQDIPINAIASAAGVTRKTVYRHLGRDM